MRYATATAAILLVAAAAGSAQEPRSGALGTGAHFQNYSFDGTGVSSAKLLLVPFAFELPLSPRFSTDVYAAFARGEVDVGGELFELNGFVDTRVRMNWAFLPWAVLTIGLNLPTGEATHDSREAVVASVLSTDLLGFREASWGTGFGLTSGVATAYRLGEWGVGLGASYRVASEFEPVADTALEYTPGNEVRMRVGIDRNVGSGKLTGGLTFQNYAADELGGRDLFQPGSRWRVDAAYSFRTGRTATWAVYFADIRRQRGDVFVQGAGGAFLPDSTVPTGTQNLLVAGVAGSLRLKPSLTVRPALDLKLQSREDPGGEGWVLSVGGDVPLRLGGSADVFPLAKLLVGSLDLPDGTSHGLTGLELGFTLRFRPGS
ncbi:MAG: hypothetical protein HY703_11030 [Gemmatimonadetes bacterium]|nr:hypothetical protein [Gemmatimonadota bacterium]